MVFSSLFFVFVFLSLSMLAYVLVPKDKRNLVLLISSLIFYSWGGPQYLFLLLVETLAAWLFALLIANQPQLKKVWLTMLIVFLIGLLAFFKYVPFFYQTWNLIVPVPAEVPNIILPIGISFYTFQLISYVVDVYRKEVKPQQSYLKLLLYASLFHQCIAGPIVRYQTVQDEIDNRSVNFDDLYYGIRRFCIGLAKKAILANGLAVIADQLAVYDAEAIMATPALGLWLGVFCYMLQLYLDFSAYSDMAIGLGRMVGFHYLENFNYPYQATSIQDFWRRWHISLSSFFRDYIYIPLGGNRGSTLVYVRNMLVVWLLTGLWHGASWNYVLWGAYYLVFLLLERFVIRQRIPGFWNRIYTLSVVFFGTMIFRYEDISLFWVTLGGMFNLYGAGFGSLTLWTTFISNIILIAAGVIACTNITYYLHRILEAFSRRSGLALSLYGIGEALLPISLLLISFIALIGNSYNPFLYFQF